MESFSQWGNHVCLLANVAFLGGLLAQVACQGFASPCAPPKQTLMTLCLYLAHNGAIFWPSAVRKVRKVTTAAVTVHAEATGCARLAQRHAGQAGAADSRAGSVSNAVIYASCLAQA